jgi:octaprenyl-diphosphate synthase
MSPSAAREALLKVATRHSLSAVAERLAALPDALEADLARLEGEIKALTTSRNGPVVGAIRHLLAAGGKRIRPTLCLLAGRAFPPNRPVDSLLTLAQAAELVHAASLMHDDVIDLGELRRGRPAPRMIYGNAASVLGGDLLLVQSFDLTQSAGIAGLLEHLLDVLHRMIAAESLQLERRGRTDLDEVDYFEIVSGKTAALFEWCAEAGARAAWAPEASRSALRLYAHEIGITFQLVDDLLDLSKDAASVGKAVLQDIRAGTMTYPVIQAARMRPEMKKWLKELAVGEEETAPGEAVLEMLHTSGFREATRREITRRTERAQRALSVLPVCQARQVLAALATGLAARTR